MECARRVIEAVTTDDVVEQAVGTRLIPLRMAHLAIEIDGMKVGRERRGGENVKDEGNAESLG